MKLALYATSVVLLAACGASAALVEPLQWLTDIRRCSASYAGNGNGSSWQDRTTAFEAFQGGADLNVTNGIETWDSVCSQQSGMDGSSASFDAWATATILASPMSNTLTAQSQSKFDTYFTITDPMEYTITGQVNESGYGTSVSMVRLTTVGGDVIESVSSSADCSRTFHLAGYLQPGTYRLYAEATARCQTMPMMVFGHGDAGCLMEFSVTPSADNPPPPPRPTTASSTGAPPRGQ